MWEGEGGEMWGKTAGQGLLGQQCDSVLLASLLLPLNLRILYKTKSWNRDWEISKELFGTNLLQFAQFFKRKQGQII